MKPFIISPLKITGKNIKNFEEFKTKILKKVESITGMETSYELQRDKNEFIFYLFFPDVMDADEMNKLISFLLLWKGMNLRLIYKKGCMQSIVMKKKFAKKDKSIVADDILKIDIITKSFS